MGTSNGRTQSLASSKKFKGTYLVPEHFILLDQPSQVVLQVLELALSLLPEPLGAHPVLEQSIFD